MVLASRRETYGMAVAEGLARGLPVVATATGSIPALVDDEAGLIVPPGDRLALADALSRMIDDAAFRARSVAGARRVRERLLDWNQAAGRLEAALRQ
jgi:glycosyltransferase involved in cell wall biosynthesis